MNDKSIGIIELTSVAAGFAAADAMLKAAAVRIVLSRSICSGKYMVVIRGPVDAVESAVAAGAASAAGFLIARFVFPNLHPDVVAAIGRSQVMEPGGALGILESFTVSALLEGADAAVKAGNVRLLEIRLAMALGGKAFCTMTGDVSAVQAAVEAGGQAIGRDGMLVNAVVIPRPHPEAWREIV